MTSPLEQCRDVLKPCPFCGAKPGTLARPDNIDGSEFYAAVFCHCEGYSATAHAGRRGKTQDEATSAAHAAWNRRAAAEAALAAQPELAGEKLYAAQSNSASAYDYCGRLQTRCCEWGAYWRASDAHGVNLSHEQALELLRDVLGVEVEIAAAIPRYIDSTPHLNVGNSAFENWFQAQPFATQAGIKQISRDIYAAGMGDPLVVAAPVAAPVAQPQPIPKERLALNVQHKDCHKAADAFWTYWNENGETHKRGYYESTWGAINRALRTVGVVEHDYPAAPKEPA